MMAQCMELLSLSLHDIICARHVPLQRCLKSSRIGRQCLAAKAGMFMQLLKTVKIQTMQRMARLACSSGAIVRYVNGHECLCEG